MAEVHGPGFVYAPRAHPKTCDWIIRDPALLDAITGNQIAVLGEMPMVCSAGAATPTGLELLAEAGLEVPASTHTYRDPQNAIEMAAHFAECGTKVVVQHIYPGGVLSDTALWIDARLLSYLNNKANLAELVPTTNLASRSIVSPGAFFGSADSQPLPVVLKVATGLSTG